MYDFIVTEVIRFIGNFLNFIKAMRCDNSLELIVRNFEIWAKSHHYKLSFCSFWKIWIFFQEIIHRSQKLRPISNSFISFFEWIEKFNFFTKSAIIRKRKMFFSGIMRLILWIFVLIFDKFFHETTLCFKARIIWNKWWSVDISTSCWICIVAHGLIPKQSLLYKRTMQQFPHFRTVHLPSRSAYYWRRRKRNVFFGCFFGFCKQIFAIKPLCRNRICKNICHHQKRNSCSQNSFFHKNKRIKLKWQWQCSTLYFFLSNICQFFLFDFFYFSCTLWKIWKSLWDLEIREINTAKLGTMLGFWWWIFCD